MEVLAKGRALVGVAISVACLWLALRNVPLGDLGRVLGGGQYLWVVPALGLQLVAILARAQRWVVLLGREDRLADSFWAEGIGYLFTNVLPLRLGEPARVLVMSERCKLPFFQVAGSAVLERLLDLASVVVLLLLVLPWMQVPSLVVKGGLTFGILVLLALAAVLLLAKLGDRTEYLLMTLGKRFRFLPVDRISVRWRELVVGLVTLTDWNVSVRSAGWSAVSWVLMLGMYWCAMRVFDARATTLEATFMVVALSLAVAVPASPGFIGVFQLIGEQALVIPFGGKFSSSEALAITLTAYLSYYLLTTALGVIGLARLGQSFANVGRAALSRSSVDAEVTG